MGAADGSGGSGWRGDANSAPTTSVPATADEELAAIFRRAAALGIPAWRVSAALGRPLPAGDGR
jgi:hypothetical protein